jgi:3-isopropylmalate dehydrogenase
MTDGLRLACMLGDGIGPEIVPVARRIADEALTRSGADPVDWVDLPMGASALAEFGYALPPANIAVLDGCDGWLAGPHDSESYPESWHAGPEGVPGVILRGHYELYANIRPSKSHPTVPSLVKDVDLVIVRENTEGFYPDRNMFSGNGEFMPTPDVALCVGKFSRTAARRIARSAFELAELRRRHVTIVHKSNVIPVCFGLFLEECRAVAREHPDVQVDDFLFDAMAAHLVRRPQAFDVIVTENLFGDTLSDLASELTGSLGMAASINAGAKYAMAQAAHGSAPDIAGQGIANPLGMVMSVAMLLQWLGERNADPAVAAAATSIDAAVDAVISTGVVTPDMGGTATTAQITEALIHGLPAGAQV